MRSSGDNLWLAIGSMLGMTAALALGDALIKDLSTRTTLWQMFALRSALAIPLLLCVATVIRGLRPRRLRAPGWVALRSALLLGNWIAYYAALPHMPLFTAAAAYYTLPIFVTLFSALFLGEWVGPLGWIAAGIGFIGVLLVLRPGATGIGWAAVLPLLAAVLYALAAVVTRAGCRDEAPMTLALGLNLAFLVAGAIGLLVMGGSAGGGFLSGPATAIDADLLRLMGALAVLIAIGSIGTAVAYQNAPGSVIGPFDFAYIGFAVLWGWVILGETPGSATLAGMGLIVAGGLLSVRASTRDGS